MTILPSPLKRNQESDPFKVEIPVKGWNLHSAGLRCQEGKNALGKKFPFCRVKEKKRERERQSLIKGEDIHYGAGKINSCACKHAHRLTSCLVRLMECDSFKWFSRLHTKGLVLIQSGKKKTPHMNYKKRNHQNRKTWPLEWSLFPSLCSYYRLKASDHNNNLKKHTANKGLGKKKKGTSVSPRCDPF